MVIKRIEELIDKHLKEQEQEVRLDSQDDRESKPKQVDDHPSLTARERNL